MIRLIGLVALAAAVAGIAPQARAQVVSYTATLNGANESPPTTSTATGTALVDYDPVAHTLRIHGTFTGLTSNTTQAHIHAATTAPLTGTAGVATPVPTFTGFPLGVTSGTFDGTLNLRVDASYNPSYETANGGTAISAEAALISAISTGRAY